MTDDVKLVILKKNLQMISSAYDDFLSHLIQQSKSLIAQEGITLVEDDINCDMLVIDYAAYLFRRRAATTPAESQMPRFLRYNLNQMLFKQKTSEAVTE